MSAIPQTIHHICNQLCHSGILACQAESCAPASAIRFCFGVLHGCKVSVKPVAYDFCSRIVIVTAPEHGPLFTISDNARNKLMEAAADVGKVINQDLARELSEHSLSEVSTFFPNFFIGGNIAFSRYGFCGVHAHVHVEPRESEDPAWNTFPAHTNKRDLTDEEFKTTQSLYVKLFRQRFGDQFIEKRFP